MIFLKALSSVWTPMPCYLTFTRPKIKMGMLLFDLLYLFLMQKGKTQWNCHVFVTSLPFSLSLSLLLLGTFTLHHTKLLITFDVCICVCIIPFTLFFFLSFFYYVQKLCAQFCWPLLVGVVFTPRTKVLVVS